ncbi:ATP-binding protein [Anaerophaga thermohalophila]|uniref:ATP-binding protein n=1 Tax=Anaerophaga thermohalophila TaxID=177400 RepID=UPI0004926552|nr:ATP-binding protein [Anaerophaga thermohalophila]
MYGLRRKLTVLMVGLVATVMLLAGLPGIYFARQKARNDAIKQMRLQTHIFTRDIEQQFFHIKDVSLALEASLRSSFDAGQHFTGKEALNRYKEKLLPRVKEILHLMRPMSLWIVFNTEHIDGKHTISFFDKNRNGIYTRSPEYSIMEKDLTHPSMRWWTEAIKKGETWTTPYYWPDWDMNVISYSRAVYVDSLLIACLGSDFNFDRLSACLDTLPVFKTGHILLFDNNDNLVYSRNREGRFSNISDTRVEKITEAKENFILINENDGNGRSAIAIDHLENGWKIALIVSQKEIFADVYLLIRTLSIMFLGGFVIAFILAVWFSKHITSPVKKLLRNFRKATDGDLSVRNDISSNDEMQELGDHFNLMMNSLESSFKELEIAKKRLTIEKERAQESDSLKSSFLENLSHEVRTPLMALVGFSELMADPEAAPDERKEFFEHIAYNSNKLVTFIEDTLLFSQLEKEQVPIRNQRFRASHILSELQEEFEKRRDEEKPDLYFRVLSDCCDMELNTDPHLLKRLVRYLLDNAFKFTDSGGVTLICRKTDHHFEISVSDSGIGISDDKTDVVFQKFRKVIETNDRIYDGAGIGLTNARGIALLLGGTIELSSTRGEGTTVTVSFPLNNK